MPLTLSAHSPDRSPPATIPDGALLIAVSPCRLALSRSAEAALVRRGVRFAFLSGAEPTARLSMDYALFVRRGLGVVQNTYR